MFILRTSSSSINYYFKRRLPRYLNNTDDYIFSSTNKIQTLDMAYGYDTIKDVSTFTKTQIKVIVTVVFIISFIMLIIVIFRFKNVCRTQETENLQTDIIRNRASQYIEPSSRRGSVGYYTQKYNRTTNIRFDDQLNTSLPAKRLSIPACDHSSKSTAAVVLLSSPVDTTVTTDATYHHHVTSSCDTSKIPNQQTSIASNSPVDIKPVTYKSGFDIDINQCDDQTPLLISELASTTKDSSNRTTRKYSLNAILPLVRPSTSHPLCSSLTSTIAGGIDAGNGNVVDLKSRRRVSLSSALRRNSFTKQPRILSSTIDSITINKTISSPIHPIDSDSSDRTSLLTNKPFSSKNQHRKNSSTIIPLSSYRKDFMQKIERFRFIDDSASSTTTVTSPVESIERENTHQSCSHLITSAIEQFDDYIRTNYHNNDDDDVNSLIDCLNSDSLINGSYSDLNILNNHSSRQKILRPQTFKPVNEKSFQTIPNLSGCQQNEYRQSIAINIPHSVTSLPLSRQRNQVEINGHSRSMDFQSISNRRDRFSTINETPSSSSTATSTLIRSLTSLEFDDNTKPSGVVVDDDFLPMSSPVDEHFWDMNVKHDYEFNNNECFPNVGSSPDIEVKHFDLQQLNTLSETSCDEDDEDDDDNHDDDDDDDSLASINQPEIFSVHEYKIKELPNPFLIMKSVSPIQNISREIIPDKSASDLSISSTEQFSVISNPTLISLDQPNDQSLLETFSSPIHSDLLCKTTPSSNQHPEPISEEDDTQESSPNDASEGEDSADNGEIDLVQEFELSQKEEQIKPNNLWSTNDHDIYIIQDDDLFSGLGTTSTIINRTQPTSIMKITNNKTIDNIDEQQQQQQPLRPKVRFNLDPQYEREREWNKVNKLLGNSVEWTDEFEV